MNVNDFISQVRALNKAAYDDSLITDRVIFNVGRDVASRLLKQEIDKRKLLNSDNVFTPIECLCLEPVRLTECGISQEGMVRRSKEQLPELSEGIYGYTIQGVYNIDNSEEIYPTTTREYINMSKLRRKPNRVFYLIKNRYLYVLNPDVENVNAYIYAADNSFLLTDCQSMYEAEIKFPSYLKSSFFKLVDEALMTFKRSRVDVNDNNLDEGQ